MNSPCFLTYILSDLHKQTIPMTVQQFSPNNGRFFTHSIIFSGILLITFLLSGCAGKQSHKGIYGPWQVFQMGPANHLRTPKGASITYNFKNDNTLIIETPYKNAKRKFKKINNKLDFNGEGLFGGFKSFVFTVSNDTLILKTKRGFVVKFARPQS